MISRKALSGLAVAFIVVVTVIAFQNCSRTSSASNTATNAGEIALNSKALSEEGELVQIEGDPYSMYEDYTDGSFKLRHFVRDKDGKEYELKSNRQQPYRSDKIKIKGRALKKSQDDSLPEISVLVEEEEKLAYAGLPTDNPYPVPDSANAYSIGEQKTLLVLVNFFDKPEQPITLSQGQAWLAQLDAFIREGSYNKTWINGVVLDWVTIDQSYTVCDSYNLGNKAIGQVRLKGYDPAQFDRLIFAFPRNGCGYSGSAGIGSQKTKAYINNEWGTGVLFHEFGHNLGLDHARAIDCDTDTLGTNCYTMEYGDSLDVMGASWMAQTGHYNPFHRLVLGWAKASDVIEVTTNGIYNIIPYAENSRTGAKILRIAKPGDPNNWFYVNMHQPIGFDKNMLSQSSLNAGNLTNGVVVREAGLYISYLLDMTPILSTSEWSDPALEVGRSFQDPFSGIRITTESVSSLGATVRVEFTGQRSCRPRSPVLNMSKDYSGYAGITSAPISFSVVSQSSLDCNTETYTLVPTLPVDWNIAFASQPLVGPAGGSVSSSLTVTPSASAPLGYANWSLQAKTEHGKASPTLNLSYNIKAAASPTPTPTPVNKAPVAVNDSVTITSKVAVTIPVLTNDSDPEGRALKVTAVSRPSAGSVKINADNTVTYTPAGKFKTSDSFSYTISDGSLTSSATVTVTLNGSSGGSGRNK